jgi:hypothetical protein
MILNIEDKMANLRTAAPEKKISIIDTPEARKSVSQAPDYKAKGVMKGRKRQISLTIRPSLLAKVDAISMETGFSRASIINLAIKRSIEQGFLDGDFEE